jgi:hypothetical protein
MRTKPTLLAVAACLVVAVLAVWLLDRKPPDRARRSEATERVPVPEVRAPPATRVEAPKPRTPREKPDEEEPPEPTTPSPVVEPVVDRPPSSNGVLLVHVVDENDFAWCGAVVRLSRFGPGPIVSVHKDGYGFQSTKCEVKAGEVHVVEIALEAAATVSLRIVDAGNRTMSGRVLLLVKPVEKGTGTHGSLWLQVAEDGCVTCRQIVPGSYEFSFHQDERHTVVRADIAPGDNVVDVKFE